MDDITLGSIGQIAIRVKDPGRAVAFYRDQLGLKHLFSAGNLSFFDCGGVRLMLDVPEKAEFDHPSSILYFKVGNIEKAHETLASRGVRFDQGPGLTARMPDHELWIAFFRDSEENLLALMCEKRR
jgi:predicted enzyme related to lactoylglutathione lyase